MDTKRLAEEQGLGITSEQVVVSPRILFPMAFSHGENKDAV